MCEKQISTMNGVLTCDRKGKHPGDGSKHHVSHPGGLVPCVNENDTRHASPHRRDGCNVSNPPLDMEFPQEPRVET